MSLELICLLIFVGCMSVVVFIPERVISVIGAIGGLLFVLITVVKAIR